MESRLARRSKSKNQEKFKRHIASHGPTDSGNNNEDRDVPDDSNQTTTKPIFDPKKRNRFPPQPSEDSIESKPGESEEANPNANPFSSRQQLRDIRSERQRPGRSLTRTSPDPNSRSSSVSSEASKSSEEPGRIKSKARTGRSLTRSGSVDSRGSGPTRSLPRVPSSSINSKLPVPAIASAPSNVSVDSKNSKPPVPTIASVPSNVSVENKNSKPPAIASVPSNVSVDSKESTSSSKYSKSRKFARCRSRKVRGSSLNRKDSQDSAKAPESDSSETTNNASGRKVSSFSKLLAEKQASADNTKKNKETTKPTVTPSTIRARARKSASLLRGDSQDSAKVPETNSLESANNAPVRKVSSFSRMLLAKKQRLQPESKPKNDLINTGSTDKKAAVTASTSEDALGTDDATKITKSTDTKVAVTPSFSANELRTDDGTKSTESTDTKLAVTPSSSENALGTDDATKSTESTDTKLAATSSSSENAIGIDDATKSTESTDTKLAATPSSSENAIGIDDATKSTESTGTKVTVNPSSSENTLGTNDTTKTQETEVRSQSVSSDVSKKEEDIVEEKEETEIAPISEKQSSAESSEGPLVEAGDAPSSPLNKSSTKVNPGKSVLIDEYGSLDVSVLSLENVEKHTSITDNGIVDEYGDPPLEELESEVTVSTNVEKYLLSKSLLATLVTSPAHEVPTSLSSVHETKKEFADFDNADNKIEDLQETIDVENTDKIIEDKIESIIDEKKEPDDGKEIAFATDWLLSCADFSHFAPPSTNLPADTQFSDPSFQNTEDAEGGEENYEDKKVNETKKESSSYAPKSPGIPVSKDYDMFDTSSWAAGSVTGFSNTAMSKVDVDINAERNFVKMMTEEMEFRTLTEEERKMMFEANERINQAEEKAKKEQNTVVKDDEPLIVQRSDSKSIEGSEANTGVSLEDRLKIYATVENDENSIDSSDEDNGSDEDDSEQEAVVEYIGQNNNDVEPNQVEVDGMEAPINLVASNDVPTLEVAASAASASSSAEVYIPKTLQELKMASPPPPPPPGLPKKKKKKKKKSKSKSDSRTTNNSIPLIAPPSEEKLKKWKDDKQTAQTCVSALAEGLANSANKTLDASSEYFHFKPVDGRKENTVEDPEKETDVIKETFEETKLPPINNGSAGEDAATEVTPIDNRTTDEDSKSTEETLKKQPVDDEAGVVIDKKQERVVVETEKEQETVDDNTAPSDTTEIDFVAEFAMKVQRENEKIVSLHTAPKNNLWRKEVADAIGLVERLQEEYDTGGYPDIAMFPSPLSDEDVAKKNSEEQVMLSAIPSTEADVSGLAGEDIKKSANELDSLLLLKVDVIEEESSRISKQASLFSSPKSTTRSTKANGFNEKTKLSSNSKSILTDSKMADKVAMASSAAAYKFEESFSPRNSAKQTSKENIPNEFEPLVWFSEEILKKKWNTQASEVDVSKAARTLLENNENFNCMCHFVADNVNDISLVLDPNLKSCDSTLEVMSKTLSRSKSGEQLLSRTLSGSNSGDQLKNLAESDSGDASTMNTMSTTSSGDSSGHNRVLLKPVIFSQASIKLSSKYLAANFVSFIYMASKLTEVCSPFGDKNPFLAMIVDTSLESAGAEEPSKTPQDLLFEELDGKAEKIIEFVFELKSSCDAEMKMLNAGDLIQSNDEIDVPSVGRKVYDFSGKRFIVPESHPSPFEVCVSEAPRIVAAVLSFLGDPVAICRMKKLNQHCLRIVKENEHNMMQDAVRTGGIEARHRPSFWLWVALEKSDASVRENKFDGNDEMSELKTKAEKGQWHHVIQRDVERSFGNMPPHKTGSKLESDSIVTALVTWGQNRLMKRGVKGGGEPVPTPYVGEQKQKQNVKRKSTNISSPPWKRVENKENDDENPTVTVSDLGAVSPQGSFVGSVNDTEDRASTAIDTSMEEVALSGDTLSADAKVDLQRKLNYILHILAATYEDIGYCQGMDYVVAHLLRNLQNTIQWKAANERLPSIISTASALKTTEDITELNNDIDSNHVVEETIVRVMDTFFVNYNLKHMYWPELRCLKTCCRVFERLIQIKLPVLADHFEHHDLNIGLFALGWFQTLFLYLPSMPSATVCHMWDIWLVERSFKIFFRVGTAILFLSQPILLNHELEGMMIYLNTIPDATLLRRDILIPCALNIKVTNQLLQELEDEVMKNPN